MFVLMIPPYRKDMYQHAMRYCFGLTVLLAFCSAEAVNVVMNEDMLMGYHLSGIRYDARSLRE